jgi:hypothetical protein
MHGVVLMTSGVICRATLVFALAAAGVSCAGSPEGGRTNWLDGRWQSQEVRLVRGDLEEIYRFDIALHTGDSTAVTGVMDIRYSVAATPHMQRIIRQDLRVAFDSAAGQVILSGHNPRVVEGPAVVGVYEADVLYCAEPGEERPALLECHWGSPAQENTPAVTLRRASDEATSG